MGITLSSFSTFDVVSVGTVQTLNLRVNNRIHIGSNVSSGRRFEFTSSERTSPLLEVSDSVSCVLVTQVGDRHKDERVTRSFLVWFVISLSRSVFGSQIRSILSLMFSI